ncbi:MAG: transcriptional repressor [Myxococcota bacterium]
MAMTREDAKRSVREAGLRATAPRVAVLRLLASTERPLSHSEVVEAIGSNDWDPATLYRNLVKLAEVGLARVATRMEGIARYEARNEGDGPHLHPHFSCRRCGVVLCLPTAKLAGPVDRAWHESLAAAELQLIGECPTCLGHDSPTDRKPSKLKRRPAKV